MEVHHLFRNNRVANAMLGLNKGEFEALVPVFEGALLTCMSERKPHRERRCGAGQKGAFKTVAEKLAFILMYLKIYPTFDVMGFLTGTERTRSCRNTHFLLGALEKALGRKFVLPERKIRSVEEFLEKFPEAKDIFFDGTERPVQRPKDFKKRKKLYSGKKKRTMRKTILMTDEKRRILLISPTKSGRRHDKRLAEKEGLFQIIPKHVAVWADSGFQGIQTQHHNTVMPKKATKKHPLSAEEKQNNRLISGIRVLVEHAIGGMKRFKAAADIYRNRIKNTDDRFNILSAGLWNLHLQQTI